MEQALINVEQSIKSYFYGGGTPLELNFGHAEFAKSTKCPNGDVKQATGCTELQFREVVWAKGVKL